MIYHRLLHCRPTTSATSCQLIQFKLNQIILSHAKESSVDQKTISSLNLDLPAECSSFDWNSEESSSIDDTSPIGFRPAPPESPIGFEFDQGRAIIGKFE